MCFSGLEVVNEFVLFVLFVLFIMAGNEKPRKENQALRNEIAELKGKLQKVFACLYL